MHTLRLFAFPYQFRNYCLLCGTSLVPRLYPRTQTNCNVTTIKHKMYKMGILYTALFGKSDEVYG